MKRLQELIEARSSAFVITDSNVGPLWLCRLRELVPTLGDSPVTVIPAEKKDLETLTAIWKALSDAKTARDGLVINFGGGTVTDVGGLAAATFKRGVDYVNVPTTLLAMADASVGGKTGIDFNGLKNEIGVFRKPLAVIAEAEFLTTLPPLEILSGMAEMLKTGLIADKDLYYALMRLDDFSRPDTAVLNPLIRRTIAIKEDITEKDPCERGLRKILNFGHTAGHAFESLAREKGRPVPHGVAVAWGMLTELILSRLELGLDSDVVYQYARVLREQYPAFPFTCGQYTPLLELMSHDKKNRGDATVNFTLIPAPGEALPDINLASDRIKTALDATLDLTGH